MAKAVVEYSGDPARWDLPKNWEWCRAKEFARIIGGGTPKNASDLSNFAEDGTPWVTPADLAGYRKATIRRGRRSLSEFGLRNSSARRLPKGTVLISSRAPVGYCAVADDEITTNQGFRSLVCDDTVDPFFIRYYVLFSRAYLEDNASGTTFKELSGTALGNLLFPVPPIETQRRIVARIDELFSELDDGEEELARARADLETYRKALLKAAVTGELTADWRAAHNTADSGNELLARIQYERNAYHQRARKPRAKTSEKSAFDLAALHDVPTTWAWAELAALVSNDPHALTDGPFGSNLKSEHYVDSGPRVIRLQNVGKDGQFVDAEAHITSDHFERLERHQVRAGDIVIAILGSPLPRAAIVPDTLGPALVKADCFKLRLTPLIDNRFVWSWLNSIWVHHACEELIHGVGRPRLGMAEIRSLPVPVPPAQEQHEIVSALDVGERSYVEALAELENLDASSALLRQSILAAAFRGELVQ